MQPCRTLCIMLTILFRSAKLLLSCLLVCFCLFDYFSNVFVLGICLYIFFLYQRADKTEQDCLALGEKCTNIPGERGKQGGTGEDGGYAGHAGKCEHVTGTGHKRYSVAKVSRHENIAVSET